MFPWNIVFSGPVRMVLVVAAANWGCTQNAARIGAPQAPVAEPTASATAPGKSEQGLRNESEPAIPFDGARPEAISVAQPANNEALEKAPQLGDVYAELTAQSLTCEETQN
ncbi:MAG: hypothetical protein FJY29_02850 [Betaproteobacteria bacterium]|nr:hypothetical protein [Betaproteobacteria bacterium]